MQTLATFSLISSLGFAYLINPIDDSLLFQATSSIAESIYQKDVIASLNNSIVAGLARANRNDIDAVIGSTKTAKRKQCPVLIDLKIFLIL